MTPTSPALSPGTLLRDAYVIHERMASGGMGEVYAATHVRLPGRLAIKVLAPHLAADPAAVARFCREAAIASVLRHPHVVQVLDFDVGAGQLPFLVMERLDGKDLAQHLLLHGPLSLERVVAIVRQLASALAAAHRLGIVHRDLKPANVMLVDYEGLPDFVKVLDFGVSKIAGVERGQGAVLGTPSYMAPEQAEGRGDEVDARTDQFSLAVLGYVLLTGRQPFPGHTTAEVLERIIGADPAPLTGRVPWPAAAVERVLARALSKRPAERFARVTDLGEALAEAARTIGDAAARRPAAPLHFQGRALSDLSKTVICLRPARSCGASNGSSRSEDVTIDALPLAINASMAEVA
jgi:eukaryotic-like serine/threonine-protein kinase